MNWYLAKFVYQIICGEGCHTPQFDEQLRLISAIDYDSAFCKAQQIGKQEQTCFYNVQQKMVQWRFINITELYCLSEHVDGAEVYSKIWDMHDADSYIYQVHEKAKQIKESFN